MHAGDIRLAELITGPKPIGMILAPLGEPVEPPLHSPAREASTDSASLVPANDDDGGLQAARDAPPGIGFKSCQ
jgi:hypothetical protein